LVLSVTLCNGDHLPHGIAEPQRRRLSLAKTLFYPPRSGAFSFAAIQPLNKEKKHAFRDRCPLQDAISSRHNTARRGTARQ
jgi:hypothetical protein